MMSEEKVEELTQVYTIPLDRVMISPRHKRAKRAVAIIKEFATKHMKSPQVLITPELNLILWSRGIRNPPKRVTVKMERDEDGVITISPSTEEVEQEE
jgi:large subunit ribosomal protein L31e